jgi:O-antigen ligase
VSAGWKLQLTCAVDNAWGGWVGPVLALSLAWWPMFAHGPSLPAAAFASAVLVAVVAWAGGRLLAGVAPPAVGLSVAAVVGAAVLPVVVAVSLDSPLAPPLGYANANAALISAAVAGLVTAWHAVTSRRARAWILAAAGAFTVTAFLSASVAGAVTCLLLVVICPVLGRGRRLWWQLSGAALLVVSVGLTALIGLAHPNRSLPVVREVLGSARPELWADAVSMARLHPVAGVGPGAFPSYSPLARDPDTAWAHSAPLQILAETGLVGFGLLVALGAWLVWSLGRAAAVLAVLTLQPMVDYVLHFPAVLVGFSLVIGASTILFQDRASP